ncbi:MAG TPA: 23S rRNA (adenine(2503)-C2)-methyltransferase, partial [Fibrobacteres bacterium]|nr:23S rRNA (adenine(2503)-C2)-methyltransferase [Fibrobacterota bacterium]
CAVGCVFCMTGRGGLVRQLGSAEIVAQVALARTLRPVKKVVFMGMGEPLDNFDHVVNAIRILSDGSGLAIPSRSITVSTVGHVPAILKLAELRRNEPHEWGRLRLAVSLNAPDDEIREAIMPVNGQWSMAELKDALQQWPLTHPDDFIFTEYVLLHGINDGPEHAHMLADYLRGLNACVNLIPYNPGLDGTYARPNSDQVKTFFHILQDAGQRCRIRGTKGDNAMAACGQLGNRTLGRKRPALETV